MTFKQAIEGPFWTGQQVPPSLTISVVPNAGQLVIQMGQQGKPVQGSGALASLVFEAIGAGTSNIHIQNPTVLGANAQTRAGHGATWGESGWNKPATVRGVTLIELLVTLVIMFILASVALPFTKVSAKRSQELELRQTLRTIRVAIDTFRRDWARDGSIIVRSVMH